TTRSGRITGALCAVAAFEIKLNPLNTPNPTRQGKATTEDNNKKIREEFLISNFSFRLFRRIGAGG
ncbi:hypothetical protein EBR21_16535, partial [bacterium]|nr:hypothetical protein [bacterium]